VKTDSKRFSERQCVVDVQTVKRQSIYGYRAGEHVPFLRIVMTMPFQIAAARRLLESGLNIGGDLGNYSCQHSFESNLAYTLRFMIDTGIVGGNWITLPRGSYTKRATLAATSTCQIEVDVSHGLFLLF
jgi:DNA polymerase delta subunit 1